MTDDELRRRYSMGGLDEAIRRRSWEVHRQMANEQSQGVFWKIVNAVVPMIGRWLKKRSDERPTQ